MQVGTPVVEGSRNITETVGQHTVHSVKLLRDDQYFRDLSYSRFANPYGKLAIVFPSAAVD